MDSSYEAGLVSVIVPAYNRARLIRETLDSVHAQTYRPIELIVIDDGSTDDTAEIVDAWAHDHHAPAEGFTVRPRRQANQGPQVARNHGLRESTGEFIQFLDSDDRLMPIKLASQVAAIREHRADYAYGQTEYVDSEGRRISVRGARYAESRPWLAAHVWHTNSPLFCRHVCEAIGPWDETLQGCQEYEYAARVKAHGFKAAFLEHVLDQACKHEGPSITRKNSSRYAEAIELAAERVLRLVPEHGSQARIERNRIAKNLTADALRYARAGETVAARRCLRRAGEVCRGSASVPAKCLPKVAAVLPPAMLLEIVRVVSKCKQATK